MTLPNITGFYPAATSNYTKGRGGRAIKYFTVHHSAGWEQTLRYLWADPNRNGSSHLYVSGTVREQYVDLNDTAWCNGNWLSNQESISCETRGDWRGYYDQATLNNLTEVMYQCLKLFPNLQLTYHKDVSDSYTLCPCDLKDKGYAAQCWQNAKNRIALENKPQPANLRVDIPDKKVILIRDSNLWDMSFTSFANAKAVAALPKGTVIDVAGVYDHPLSNSDYYLSKYSWDRGINNGINRADCEDYVPPVLPPTPTPEPPAQVPPVEPTPTPPANENPGTLPPVPVDPDGNPLEDRVSKLEEIVKKIVEFLTNFFKNFKI
ncbi:N-acetylmuramoyl-L-alanine amidase [Caudoviricetes sp.]|nr:N-acetylmuramoyl-L-alanine amidase [Caudoviricetes sp.]